MKGGIEPIRSHNGILTTEVEEKEELLVQGTSIIGSESDLSDTLDPQSNQYLLSSHPVPTRRYVEKSKTSQKKGAGPNKLPHELLKLATQKIPLVLTPPFNSFLAWGHYHNL
ncbi:hypothetical protein O181_020997 [Austropuccinia psidii MF-1]|uniref:Uncharacterized protein n=1 Tax=Austropuccinia psidii MF-1 TaxID=1389203 RepID=A0A9Q3CCQ6_9BASI|nr:hypothetical protein [Austropuccinia psidii MF-1]